MLETQIFPAPAIASIPPADPKWEAERRAFLQLLPALMMTHRGKYVAIHQGKVVETGEDQVKVALAAYAKQGYLPMYVGLVSDQPPPIARIPSAHQPKTAGA
jgi:hypothetical protein